MIGRNYKINSGRKLNMRTFIILSVAICACLSSCRNGNEKSAAAGLNVDKAKIKKIYEKLEKGQE